MGFAFPSTKSFFRSLPRKRKPQMLSRIAQKVARFLKAEEGPTAVEYAVMLALIIVVCLSAITSLGTAANSTFGNVSLNMAASGS
jgi:pilus assembly protein Flp/PilA